MVVQRGRAHAERGRDAGEADRVQALGVGDRDRGVDHAVTVQAGARHYEAFEIAASIAAPGSSTIRPCPGARRAGSRARSARALSSAVGRCQVASTGSGNSGLAFALVATPASVE